MREWLEALCKIPKETFIGEPCVGNILCQEKYMHMYMYIYVARGTRHKTPAEKHTSGKQTLGNMHVHVCWGQACCV